jgi:predicted nucleic acid-binding protein
MKYVLDASVGLKWVMNEVDSDKAQHVRDSFRSSVHERIAPESYILETAHGLTKAERRGTVTDAETLWTELMMYCPQLFPTIPLMAHAIQIARRARIGVYDCLYVALADREVCELITAEDRLVRSLQPSFPFIRLLAPLS